MTYKIIYAYLYIRYKDVFVIKYYTINVRYQKTLDFRRKENRMTVYELLQVPSLKNNLKVIAGESGLDRKISSVTVIDTPDGLNWLRGNEVVITTAYAVSDKEETFIEFTT